MSRLPVQPTKSNLLALQEELDFARTGHQLLQEKREILLLRIRELIESLQQHQVELYAALDKAYGTLSVAVFSMGWRRLESFHVRPDGEADVTVVGRHYMGLSLPELQLGDLSSRPRYSPAGTNSLLDAAQKAFVELLPLVIVYAEHRAHLFSLSEALKKTMKRVNALENIFIPDYDDTVAYVAETLEELEREEMFIRKLVKSTGEHDD